MFYQGKKVLVTGGTGFVGMAIVRQLLKAGARVRVSVHRRPLALREKRIEKVKADLTQEKDALAAAKGVDYVFHAAGAVSAAAVTASNPMNAITTNLVLTARVLEAAWTEGVKGVLIFGSSTGYPAADHPVKEEEMWAGPPYESYFGYGWMRRYLERLGEFVASKSSMKVAIVRPSAVYGPGDDFDLRTGHVIPSLIRRAVSGEDPFVVWGTGEEVRDFLHIDDLAAGCLSMMERGKSADPVNIGYGVPVKIKDIVSIILKCAGRPQARVVFDTSKPTTIPVRMVDIAKARATLGFEPTIPLEQGLRETVDWYLAHRT